jgi:hypothetical protein
VDPEPSHGAWSVDGAGRAYAPAGLRHSQPQFSHVEWCTAGFKEYAGQTIGGPGPMTYAMTYLIDSDQNRTSSNPDPSTVICLLEAAGSGPLTSSARS